jgi:hypothetical protein
MGMGNWRPSFGDLLAIGAVVITGITWLCEPGWGLGLFLSLVIVVLVVIAAIRYDSHPVIRVGVSVSVLAIYFVFVGPRLWADYTKRTAPEVATVENRPIASEADAPQGELDDFKSTYAAYPKLGKALRPIITSSDSYIGIHENAIALWIQPILTIFILPADKNKKMIRFQELSRPIDFKWYDDAQLRAYFKTPSGKFPPFGGIATDWNKWNWIGWRLWHCSLKPNLTFYQEFENGIIVGMFPNDTIHRDGRIFVIFNDDTFVQREANSYAPFCAQP